MPRLNRQRWWMVSLLLCVIAGGLAIWLGQRVLRPQQYLIARLEAELPTTPTEELGIKLRQLAAFGEDGVPSLVRALKQPQREIADEARGVISEELDQWQILSHREASRRLAKLAQALATDIETSDDNTRRICGDFATRLLLWPVDTRAVDQQQLITDCERVLVSVRGGRYGEAGQVRLAGAAFVPRAIDSQTTGGLSPLDDSLVIPGGDLPHDAVGVPRLPPTERGQPRMLPAGNEPH
ncbi:MAG TPA: hypothetical protein VL096_12490, partial [Pirellulaceae bacterium]|nr:hypothetical protein [Pirellulaceae bacterium]